MSSQRWKPEDGRARLTVALAPPRPKELTQTRSARSSGQERDSVGTVTLSKGTRNSVREIMRNGRFPYSLGLEPRS